MNDIDKNTIDKGTINKIAIDKDTIKRATQLFKALGDQTRLSIVTLLLTKEWRVSDLQNALGMEQSAVSHKLKTLKIARLVKSRRKGKSVYYSLDDQHVIDLLHGVYNHLTED